MNKDNSISAIRWIIGIKTVMCMQLRIIQAECTRDKEIYLGWNGQTTNAEGDPEK